jgi:predicted metal-dependent hydrolase
MPMVWASEVKPSTTHRIQLGCKTVDYRVVCSKAARKLRVRIGPNGVEVVQPTSRNGNDISEFLVSNSLWIVEQLERSERLRRVRKQVKQAVGEILFRGEPTRIRLETTPSRAIGNSVRLVDGEIVISQGAGSRTPIDRSLEAWLRREARCRIETHLDDITARLGERPERIYIMAQRTKWGNCSARRNLSFNWRLVLAPDYVLRYLVTHEAVHLAIPDHSAKFWLTVKSLCKETERARQWLCVYQEKLYVDLSSLLGFDSGFWCSQSSATPSCSPSAAKAVHSLIMAKV